MDGNHHKKQLERLGNAFNYEPTPELASALWDVIQSYDNIYLTQAVTHLINTQTRYPANALIIQAVREAFNADWQKEKDADKERVKKFSDPNSYNTQYDRDALACFQKVINARNRFTIVKAMKEMHELYPDKGYNIELQKLRNQWERKAVPNVSQRPV